MTSWIALAAGTALAGFVIGRSAMTFSRSGSGRPEQRKHQGRALQGWMLLTFGIVNAIAAGITTQSRVLELAIAAVSIPLAIAILIKNRRSNAGDEKQMGGTVSSH